MMKTLLFRLMLLISIAGIGGISARAQDHILKVVRINPGDTVSTELLTPLTSEQYSNLRAEYQTNIRDLILIKNGGDCKIKITDMLEGSFYSPYGALICTDSIVSVPAIADFYHFFYKTKDGIGKSVGFGVNFYGVAIYKGKEAPHKGPNFMEIEIKDDKDLDETIDIPGSLINFWYIDISPHFSRENLIQIYENEYSITIRDLLIKAKEKFPKEKGPFYLYLNHSDGSSGFDLDDSDLNRGIYFNSRYSFSLISIKDSRDPTGIETINSDTPKETRIYDLQGHRLSKLQKGINIVNGKKVLIR